MNVAALVEYDGTRFAGFQRQSADKGPTVQGAIEAAQRADTIIYSIDYEDPSLRSARLRDHHHRGWPGRRRFAPDVE